MNRFSSYLQGQQLAKLLMLQAEDELAKNRDHEALRDVIKACQAFFRSTNCVASLALQPRKKYTGRN